METLQLKRSLHELIEQIGDNRLLEAVYTILNQTKPAQEPIEDDFVWDEATRKLIDERIAHYKAHPEEGDSWPNVKARIQKRLEENRQAANRKFA